MKKTFGGLSILIALSVVLAACTSAAPVVPVASKAGASSSGEVVNVEMKSFAFSPQELTIKVGTKVTWTNMDSAGHDVKAADGSWGSDTLAKGQSFSRVFDKEGTYPYVCTFHARMTGTIIVTK